MRQVWVESAVAGGHVQSRVETTDEMQERGEVRGRPAPRARRPARGPGLRGRLRALAPRGRAARILAAIAVTLIAVAGLSVVVIYGLVATGILSANLATPYIERALEERIGGGLKVSIGETSMGTAEGGGTMVVVHDIKVTGPDGQLVAGAPKAEVELEGALFSLMPKARRVDLVGAEMTVRIGAAGQLQVATGRGAKPLSPAAGRNVGAAAGAPGALPASPPQQAAPVPGAPAPGSAPQGEVAQGAAAPGSPAPGIAPAGSAAPVPAPWTPLDPLKLEAFAQWLKVVDDAGFDGGALADVGLKDGTLIVENESSGRRIVFQHIGVRLARPVAGGAVLTFTSQGPQYVSTAVAEIGPAQDGERAIAITVKDVSTRDLVQAFSQDHRRFYMDTPLNATASARIGLDGTVRAARAEVVLGAGALGNGEEPQERFVIDGARIAAVLDPQARRIVLEPVRVTKNKNIVALTGEIAVPAEVHQPWPFALSQQEVVLAGPEMPEPPLVISKVAISGRFLAIEKQLVVEQGELVSATGSFSFTATADFGVPAPMLHLKGTASPMPAATVKRFWPVSIAPPARQFVIENVSGGTADGISLLVDLPIDLIGQKQLPLPDDGLRFTLNAQGVTVRPVKGLPPIANARISVVVTGRTVRITLPDGTAVTPQNRKIAVSDGVMFIADHFPREPSAQIRVKFDGPADAGIEVLGMEALKGPAGQAFDPSTTRGRLSALLQVNIIFRQVPRPEDLDYALEASLTDFGVDKVFKGQRLEGATVKAFASPAGIVLRGEGKLGGAPIAFEYEKKKDAADSDIRVSATLDDAARARLGVDVPGVSGPVQARLSGVTNNRDTRASIELDLTQARLSDLVPGLSKPAGKPLKGRFVINDRGRTVKLEDFLLEGSGALLKGAIELSDNGDLLAANLPVLQLSDGDKAQLKAEKVGEVLKIRITGEVMDARGIMKSLMGTPAPGRRNQKTPDVDVEARVGALTGNNGEVMRQFELQVSRRGVEITAFDLAARVGRDGVVGGKIRDFQARQKAMHINATDAGALLRFLDIYPKVQGGTLWVAMDPPRSDNTPQEGVIHLSDFAIRGEPGLERLSSAVRDSSGRIEGGSAAFEKAQAQFARTTGKVVFREGAFWGSSVGATFDGTLDFAADRIAIRGTFVPAYALNNMFSKLPLIGMFLGGGPNEGLVGVTFEIVGPMGGGPTLRINPISAVAPGFLRKIFEFRSSADAAPGR